MQKQNGQSKGFGFALFNHSLYNGLEAIYRGLGQFLILSLMHRGSEISHAGPFVQHTTITACDLLTVIPRPTLNKGNDAPEQLHWC